MHQRIHDDELDTSESVVRAVLAEQLPDVADLPVSAVASTGTSNSIWRIHCHGDVDLAVRLPRRKGDDRSLAVESEILDALIGTSVADLVDLPRVRLVGAPSERFPCSWSILEWIDGDDLWTTRHGPLAPRLPSDVADVVAAISGLEGIPAPTRELGERGGALPALLDRLDRWLDTPEWFAADLIDVARVRRSAAEAAEVADEPVDSTFVHGDLIPGNLLVGPSGLSALIDWGGAGYGDPAQDLAPAWSVFEGTAALAFRAEVDVDDATWLRARAIELEHAVGGVLYYRPRRHPLGDVMARTLQRILDESPLDAHR